MDARARIARSNRRVLLAVVGLCLLGTGVPFAWIAFGDTQGRLPNLIRDQEREVRRAEGELQSWRAAREVAPFDPERSPIAELELEERLARARAVLETLRSGEFEPVRSKGDVKPIAEERVLVEQFGPSLFAFRLDDTRFPAWAELDDALRRRR